MIRIAQAFIFLFCISAYSAIRYVDNTATGANDGSSWADAWDNLSHLDRDTGGVSAGDTVYIAGRSYTNTAVLPLKEGTAGNWTHYYFTNGVATIYCRLTVRSYTEVNGCAAANYETNIVSTYDVQKITNNCNLWIYRFTNWYNVGSIRSIYVIGSPAILKWIHITGATNKYDTDPPEFLKSDSGNEIYYDGGATATTNEWGYIWIDMSSGHGAGAALAIGGNTAGTQFGCFNIHHCLLENNGSDVCNMSGGVDFHHNIVRRRYGLAYQGCNDTFTVGGDSTYDRIYNNLIEPADNTLFYTWGLVSNIHDFYFYGNVLTPVQGSYRAQNTQGSGIMEQDVMPNTMYYMRSNVVWANNTWIGTTNDGPGYAISFVIKNGIGSGFTINTNGLVLWNNLFVQIDTNSVTALRPLNFHPSGNNVYGSNDLGYGWAYDSNTLVMDYNLFATYTAGNLKAANWGQSGETEIALNNASDITAYLGSTHNLSITNPILVDAQNYDYRPASTVVNIGTNLSAWTNLMPDLTTDIYGRQRSSWSAGAIEYQPVGGLLLWLTFSNDWSSTGIVLDQSGWSNHAYAVDFAGWPVSTWPTATNGPVASMPAAQFVTNYFDGSFTYGTYFAVTNFNGGLDALTNGTWALWAAYDSTHFWGTEYASFLNCGYLPTNTWRFFGSYYDVNQPCFGKCSDVGEAYIQFFAKWPATTDRTWNHYAITWDGTNFVAYLNGASYSTNGPGATNTFTGELISTNSAGGQGRWIGVGVATHNGTYPRMDADALPNHGQLYGQLADIRIYNRGLSSAEILGIYNNGVSGSTPTRTANAVTVHVGTMTQPSP